MNKFFTLLLCIFFLNITCNINPNKDHQTKSVFRYNESAGISSLDPAFSRNAENIWAVNQIYNGLVQMNDNLEIKPCIAKSWEVSKDGLKYIFHLNTDIYFHDHKLFPKGKGRKVIASDHQFVIQRNRTNPCSNLKIKKLISSRIFPVSRCR